MRLPVKPNDLQQVAGDELPHKEVEPDFAAPNVFQYLGEFHRELAATVGDCQQEKMGINYIST